MPSMLDGLLLTIKAVDRIYTVVPVPLREAALDAMFGKAEPYPSGYDPSRLLPGPKPA